MGASPITSTISTLYHNAQCVFDGGELGSITWTRKKCNSVRHDRQSVQSFVNANDNTPVMDEMAIAA